MSRSQPVIMKIKKFFANKKPAQAMVEFAIALPVLLMLLYGILEAGRFLFLYSTVVTASRQAVRYGTATGDGGGATPIYGSARAVVPRYRDCAGIRGAGNAVGYITRGGFTYQLSYDIGPGTGPTFYCTGGTATEVTGEPTDLFLSGADNRARLVVTVSTEFVPIVPKLVPFVRRTITATSARTILYSVAIVVDQAPIIVPQSPTTTTITSDTPDPSEMGQTVTITVVVSDVDDPTNTPLGTVEVTGADNSCTIALVNGTGSCTVSWATSGTYTLGATYTPNDEDHLPSTDPDGETHTVQPARTTTTIIGVSPEPSIAGNNNPVTVSVTVTGGSTTPTGQVNIDAGGGRASCTVTLVGGAGSCVIYFNNSGLKTINAAYVGDSGHQGSTAPPVGHEVLDVTPTPRPTSTITPIPSATSSPTPTLSPTPNATPVASCTGITHGPIRYSSSNMTMTVTNPFPFTLTMSNATVTWNDDKGHKTGSDKTLKLVAAWVNGAPFWTGTTSTGVSTITLGGPASFPPGTSTITFTFDKSYDNPETTDNIVINWLTPGCESNGVDSSH